MVQNGIEPGHIEIFCFILNDKLCQQFSNKRYTSFSIMHWYGFDFIAITALVNLGQNRFKPVVLIYSSDAFIETA